jgi:DNA-binding MarR family transcriptional regulator
MDHPDSGVAARYKRLGLSVRQGQKLKARLASAGLIGEQEEATKTGRIRRIRLTDKGRRLLARAKSAQVERFGAATGMAFDLPPERLT